MIHDPPAKSKKHRPRVEEYRVVSRREGQRQRARAYRTMRGAERRLALYSDEPWTAYGVTDPESLFCCSGRECGCGGLTHRERSAEVRANMPKLLYALIETRLVTRWRKAP